MQILDNLFKLKGLYHRIFGELLDNLIYNKEIEEKKIFLKNLGFEDVDIVFKKEIDKNLFYNITKIIFKLPKNMENEDKK